jgi:hypothetical protein
MPRIANGISRDNSSLALRRVIAKSMTSSIAGRTNAVGLLRHAHTIATTASAYERGDR